MIVSISNSRSVGRLGRHLLRALTTTEMIITLAIFCVVMLGAIQLHLFGLRQDELVESKLGASDQARMSFAWMVEEIQGAKMWEIGEGSESGFTRVPNGTLQEGSALQLYPTASTNTYIRYFFDADAKALRVMGHNENGPIPSRVVARNLTNSVFFSVEDHLGNVKRDLSYKSVVHARFEFFQFEFPTTQIGEGLLYDYYKLEFKVTPHSPDGA